MRPRLFLGVVSMTARTRMSYRVDFWITTLVSFVVDLAVAYYLWLAIFSASGATEIGGFSLAGMTGYYVLVILLGKLVRGDDMSMAISRDIYEGDLNKYLLYPVSYRVYKYAEHLGGVVPAILQVMLFGVGMALLFDLPTGLTITPVSVLMATVSVAVANLL
ncbi:MAG: ABC-2 family transporter protein, partial [Acidobacteriota bacterium]